MSMATEIPALEVSDHLAALEREWLICRSRPARDAGQRAIVVLSDPIADAYARALGMEGGSR